MKKVLLVFMLLAAQSAFATEEVDCDATCADGEKIVSFADGDTTTCACVEQGSSMDETVENLDTPESDWNENGTQTQG